MSKNGESPAQNVAGLGSPRLETDVACTSISARQRMKTEIAHILYRVTERLPTMLTLYKFIKSGQNPMKFSETII